MKTRSKVVSLILAALIVVTFFSGTVFAYPESDPYSQDIASSSTVELPISDESTSLVSSSTSISSGEDNSHPGASSAPASEEALPDEDSSTSAIISDSSPVSTAPIMPATATFTVRFFDWDSRLLVDPQQIEAGANAEPPSSPTRSGFSFTGWSVSHQSIIANTDIYAQYSPLITYTITIQYIYANNTNANAPYIATVNGGGTLSGTVPSPTITGYTPDEPSIILNLANIQQNYTYTVVYTPEGDIRYTVEHYLQNQNLNTDLSTYIKMTADTQTATSPTDSLAAAGAHSYPGFSPPSVLPTALVAGDGSTVLKVYYTRNQYAVYFAVAGGSYVAPYSAPYSATISLPVAPTRLGYSFAGWDTTLPTTMPANDITLTAKWTPANNVSFTQVFWLENISSTGYDYVGTNISANNTAGTAPAIPSSVPSGVTFPIASTYYTINTTKTGAEKPTVISGDGSSILNVYYDRNTYNLNFAFDASKYRLTVGGTTYTTAPYVLTAKFGAAIDAKWPGTPTLLPGQTGDGTFVGWNSIDAHYVTKQYFLDASIVISSTFSALWNTSSKNITAHYMLPNLTGIGYSDPYSQVVAISFNSTKWNAKSFMGFTAISNQVTIAADNSVTFYYTRNKYNITYYNNNIVYTSRVDVPYQTEISTSAYSGVVPTRPAGTPDDYVFKGWYASPQGYDNSKFVFAGAMMPAYNLILYARWDKPQYTVTFNPNNGSDPFSQTLPSLNTLATPPVPTKPGFAFNGWFRSGAALRYQFGFPVNENFTLTAQWVATSNVTYDVVYMKGDEEFQRQSFGGKSVEDSVTATAIFILGFRPDAVSKTINLAATGNTITFSYTPIKSAGYTVHYLNINGGVLASSKSGATTDALITESYLNIPGYYPDYYQKTLHLTPNADSNSITFYYTQNQPANYTVRTYLEGLDGGYTYTSVPKSLPMGSTATEDSAIIPGYKYEASLSINGRVVTSNGTILRLYYNRTRHSANFTAVANGTLTGTTSFTDIRNETPFANAVVTPTPVPDPGYMFTGWNPALPAPTDPLQADVTSTATFTLDPLQWGVVSFNSNGGSGNMDPTPSTLIGTSYTLPESTFLKQTYTFFGWNTQDDGDGTDYAVGDIIPFPGTVTLYAQWVEIAKHSVTYLAGGGTGSMETTGYHTDTSVPVATSTFTYPGYSFVNWKDQNRVSHDPGTFFTITEQMHLTAQWKEDPDQWGTTTFAPNPPSGVTVIGSMPNDRAVIGTTHTLPANAFTADHYTFTGWNTDSGGRGIAYANSAILPFVDGGTLQLYAQWKEDPKCIIIYKSNDPRITPETDLTVDEGTYYVNEAAIILSDIPFAYANYDFIRWSTQADGEGTSYVPGSSLTITPAMVASGGKNLEIYADWLIRDSFTVLYSDGFTIPIEWEDPGSKNPHYVDTEGVIDLTVKENTYTRVGYSFKTWLTNATVTLPSVFAAPLSVIHDLEEDISFTAQWQADVYGIDYNLDGGAMAGEANPANHTIESPSFSLLAPTKDGYDFTGWSGTGITGTSKSVLVGAGTYGNLAFTAHWKLVDYDLLYNLNGGIVGSVNPSSYNITDSGFTLNNPSKNGYTFTGWTGTNLGSPSTSVGIPSGSFGALTFTANYSIDTYPISYDLDGGTANSSNPNDYTIETPDFILAPPAKEGYTFAGWTGTGITGSSLEPSILNGSSGNASFTATWGLDTYYINYNLDGGTVEASNPTEYTFITQGFTLNNPTKPHYTFIGWTGMGNIAPSITTTISNNSHGDLNLTARYTPDSYTIAYNLDGGIQNTPDPTSYTVETPTFNLENPTKAGYLFSGWSGTDITGTAMTQTIPLGSFGNAVYTANWQYDATQWSSIRFVSFDALQGQLSGTLSFTGIIGSPITPSAITLPHLVPAAGYMFHEWSSYIPSHFPSGDLSITAFWSKKSGSSSGSGVSSSSSSSGSSSSSRSSGSSRSSRSSGSSRSSSGSGISSSSGNGGGIAPSSTSLSITGPITSSRPPNSEQTASAVNLATADDASSTANSSSIILGGNSEAERGASVPSPISSSSSASTCSVSQIEPPFASLFAIRVHWALINLLCAVVSLVAGLLMLISALRNKNRRQKAEKNLGKRTERSTLKIVSIVVGGISPIVFFLTENMYKAMVWADGWTLIMVLLIAVQLVCIGVSHRQKRKAM